MQKFDSQKWREKIQNGKSSNKVAQLTAICDIGKVIAWCEKLKITVFFKKLSESSTGGEYYPDDSVIHISSYLQPQKQLFVLLHECGHHIIHTGVNYHFHAHEQNKPNLISSKVDALGEEFNAWDEAFRLSVFLNTKLDQQAFRKFRTQCLYSYIQSTAGVF